MKHFTSSLLALVFWFAPMATTFSQTSFADVKTDSPYYQQINYLKQNNIAQGYQDGTYGINNDISRAELIKIFVNATIPQSIISSCLERNAQNAFRDVPQNDPFANYICVSQEYGIVAGYSDGTFRPNNNVTYGEAAKIALNTFFPFEPQKPRDLDEYVDLMSQKQLTPPTILSSNPIGTPLNRGEMADIIYGSKVEKQDERSSQEGIYLGKASKNMISFEQARDILLDAFNEGMLKELELEYSDGLVVYEFSFGDYIGTLDSITGVILEKTRNIELEDIDPTTVIDIITLDQAKAAALEAVNVSDVLQSEIELDREEDGSYVYNIYVKTSNSEFEIELNAETKEIIEIGEFDIDPKTVTDIITPDQAEAAALEAINVSDVLQSEIELDREEDGSYVYNIYVETSDSEFEIELNAKTKDIIEIVEFDIDSSAVNGIFNEKQIKNVVANFSLVPDTDDVDIELMRVGDNYFFVAELEIDTQDNEDIKIEIEINATNGQIIEVSFEKEDEDDHDEDDHDEDEDDEDEDDEDEDDEDEDDEDEGSSVTESEAREIALKATNGGRVYEVELERGVFEIEIETNSGDREIGVDASTGRVLWNKIDD